MTSTGGAVVLALHYQNEVLHEDGKIRVGVSAGDPRRLQVIEAAKRLLTWARSRAVPIVFVRIAFRPDHADVIQNCRIFRDVVRLGAMAEGSWGACFLDSLAPLEGATQEFVVTHSRVNAFYGSQLEEVLTLLRAQRLLIGGISTHSVVATTAAHAADAGYEVAVIADACSSGDPAVHLAALRNIELIGEIRTTGELDQLVDSERLHG